MAKRSLRRYAPEVGAECLNWARSDLCGGRSAMTVPTAIDGVRGGWLHAVDADTGAWKWSLKSCLGRHKTDPLEDLFSSATSRKLLCARCGQRQKL